MEHDALTFWGRLWRLSPFFVLAGAGIAFAFWPGLASPTQILLTTLGTTFLVIFILGLTTDFWLKKAILDDVVKASLGYVLPEELKSAMRWVYTQHIICIRHEQTVEITHNSNDPRTVTVTTRTTRILKNVGGGTETAHIGLAVEEWFEDCQHSDILELGYRHGEQQKSLLEQKERSTAAILVDKSKNPVKLQKGETVTVWSAWKETKRVTDGQYGFYTYPTVQPTVTVKAPDDIEITAGFTLGHNQNAMHQLGEGKFMLDDTLLPLQPIGVSWWVKAKSREWMSGSNGPAPSTEAKKPL